MSKITEKAKARFYKKVEVTSGCWNWIGAKRGARGYGAFHLGGVVYSPHRVMFAMMHPEHEDALLTKRRAVGYRTDYVLHSCDNPSCVNPEHLRMGDATDNAQDRKKRNRNPRAAYPGVGKGERRGPDIFPDSEQ